MAGVAAVLAVRVRTARRTQVRASIHTQDAPRHALAPPHTTISDTPAQAACMGRAPLTAGAPTTHSTTRPWPYHPTVRAEGMAKEKPHESIAGRRMRAARSAQVLRSRARRAPAASRRQPKDSAPAHSMHTQMSTSNARCRRRRSPQPGRGGRYAPSYPLNQAVVGGSSLARRRRRRWPPPYHRPRPRHSAGVSHRTGAVDLLLPPPAVAACGV